MNPSASLTAGSPLFTARSIGAAYGRIQVVFDVDLEVRSGELLGLLGPNGAGKSSLLGPWQDRCAAAASWCSVPSR